MFYVLISYYVVILNNIRFITFDVYFRSELLIFSERLMCIYVTVHGDRNLNDCLQLFLGSLN